MISKKNGGLFCKNALGAEIRLGDDTDPVVVHWARKRAEEKITTSELFEILGLDTERAMTAVPADIAEEEWQMTGKRLLLQACYIGNHFSTILDFQGMGGIKVNEARLLTSAIRILRPPQIRHNDDFSFR